MSEGIVPRGRPPGAHYAWPSGAVAHRVHSTDLLLLPQRAAYVPAQHALLVADVHLGKAATFRSLGVPVPSGTTLATLARLDALVAALQPRVLVVLGDLLHGPVAQRAGDADELARWRASRPGLEVLLVRGNHDDRAGDPPAHCAIRVVDEPFALGELVLRHEPGEDARGYVLAGHVHPAFRLSGRVDSLRLPCFWLRERYGVLPAFGEFTGGWAIQATEDDCVFVTDDERVHAVHERNRWRAP